MAEKELSRVQKMILDVFKPVYEYMNNNGIEYYMLGGTLLGAIRHKGFIPWDDDIDIGVPREDYEKIMTDIQKNLPSHLRLDTFRNSDTHHYYFARIVDTRYSLKRLGSVEERDENVWIDIFPLDGMPDNALVRKIHMWKLLYTRAMYHISCFEKVNLKRPNRPLSERIVIKFVQITGFGRGGNTRKRLEKLDKLMKKYSIRNTGYVSNFMGQYKFKEMFPKAYYGNGTLYDFEDYKLMGPDNYDAVLTQMYGDYMTPPKDADKNAHAAVLNEEKEG